MVVARRDEVWHVQCRERFSFGAMQRPEEISVLVPVRQSGEEVRLRRPDDAVVHRAVIAQTLEQHVIELGRPDDFAYRNGRKAIKQIERRRRLELAKKHRVGLKA